MGKISPGKDRDNRAISKEEAKAEALRIIEEKLKNVEEKRVEEESKEGNNGFVGKKKSHFFSDLKVSRSASSHQQLVICISGLCYSYHNLPHGSWCRSSEGNLTPVIQHINTLIIHSTPRSM